jgi:hypothetical protein
MNPRLLRYVLIARRGFKKAFDPVVGFVAVTLLKLIRRGDRVRFANAAAASCGASARGSRSTKWGAPI